MGDSKLGSETEEDETKPRSPLKITGHKYQEWEVGKGWGRSSETTQAFKLFTSGRCRGLVKRIVAICIF